jgi:hypothetical protein
MEQRIRYRINKKTGEFKLETLGGYTQDGCHQALEAVAAAVGATSKDGGDKDDYIEDVQAMVNL